MSYFQFSDSMTELTLAESTDGEKEEEEELLIEDDPDQGLLIILFYMV